MLSLKKKNSECTPRLGKINFFSPDYNVCQIPGRQRPRVASTCGLHGVWLRSGCTVGLLQNCSEVLLELLQCSFRVVVEFF
jgi:hypothetical protein